LRPLNSSARITPPKREILFLGVHKEVTTLRPIKPAQYSSLVGSE
jgi:hypothetical protein